MTAGRCHCEALDTEWLFLCRVLSPGEGEGERETLLMRGEGGMGKNQERSEGGKEKRRRHGKEGWESLHFLFIYKLYFGTCTNIF